MPKAPSPTISRSKQSSSSSPSSSSNPAPFTFTTHSVQAPPEQQHQGQLPRSAHPIPYGAGPGSTSTMHYLLPDRPAPPAPTGNPGQPGQSGQQHPGQPEPAQAAGPYGPTGVGSSTEMSRTMQLALVEPEGGSAQLQQGQEAVAVPKPSVEVVRQEDLFPDPPAGEGSGGLSDELRYSDLTDAQILALTQSLKEDEASKRPLISPIEPLSVLTAEYAGGSGNVLKKLDWLQRQGWRGIRRTRGDGDCFYRSLAFSYVERLLLAPDPALAVAMSLSTLQDGRHLLDDAGFQELVYEDFYDVLTSLINSVISPSPSPSSHTRTLLSGPSLLTAFQDAETSNSIVVYLRLLTSAYIRSNPDSFAPYLLHPETGEPMPVQEFCEREVEASGKEADHVQEMALASALKLSVRVAYLDGSDPGPGGGVDFVRFESEESVAGNGMHEIALLYRPGHFDILETRDRE